MATTKIPQELLEKTSITFADNEKLNFGTGNDLQIFHNGTDSHIQNTQNNGVLRIRSQETYFLNSDNNETQAKFIENGAVELYHNNVKKLYTNASGVDIVGTAALTGGITVQDDQVAYFGTGLDLRISHVSSSGSNLIQSYTSGELVIESNGNTKIRTNNGDDMAKFLKNGAVELYYDNVKKFETTSTGISVTGTVTVLGGEIFLGTADSSSGHINALENMTFNIDTDNDDTNRFFEWSTNGTSSSGTELMRLTDDGNLGIGTNSPGSKLHVANGTDTADSVRISGGHTGRYLGVRSFENNSLTGAGFILNASSSGGAFKFQTTSTDRMIINHLGNVGIGTNSPQHKLDTVGTIRHTSDIVSNTVYKAFSIGSNRTVNDYGGLNKDYWAIQLATPGASTDGQSSAHGYGALKFSGVSGSDTTLDDVLVLNYNGNVGIGTSNPQFELDVTGLIRATADVYLQGDVYINSKIRHNGDVDNYITFSAADTQGFITGNSTRLQITNSLVRFNQENNNQDFSVYSANSDNMLYVDASTDRVGIGTASPSTTLTVKNDSAATSFGANNIITIQNANTTDNSRMGLAFTGNTGIGSGLALVEAQSYDQSHGKTSLNFSVYSGSWHNDMMVLKEGKVGIGTNSPAALLTIQGTGDALRVESTNAGASGAQLDLLHHTASPADNDTHAVINFGGYYSGSSSAYGSAIKSIWTDVSARQAAMTFTVRTGGNFTERMRIFYNGRINVTEDDHTGVTEVDRILNWYGGGGTELNNSKHFLTAVNNRSETTQPMDVGLALTNKNTTNSNWSPAITFGGMSKNNGYMNGGAAIASQNTQNSADANFITSDLHFFTKNEDNSKSLSSKMKISGDGIVTTPQQPKFLARRNGSGGSYNPYTYSLSIPYNNTIYDEGSNFNTSTGLFTAPVDGMYMFQGSIYSVEASSGGWVQAWLTINGARGNYTDVAGNGMDNARIISTIHMVKLESGDTVGYHPYGSNRSYQVYDNVYHTWFKGTLLG